MAAFSCYPPLSVLLGLWDWRIQLNQFYFNACQKDREGNAELIDVNDKSHFTSAVYSKGFKETEVSKGEKDIFV